MNLKLLLSILSLIYFKSANSGEFAFFNSTTISNTSNSTTPTSNITITYNYKKEYLICDFNDPTSTQNICGGTFTNNANGNNVGIYQTLKIYSNEITDYTSIYEKTRNGLKCNIPFRYNIEDNYFCTKISDLYQCETSDGYSECNLGRFYGIKIQSDNLFDISWELDSAIMLLSSGNYTLKFYVFYYCYLTLSVSSNECTSIADQLAVYTKSYSTESYSIVKTYKYSYLNSNNKWIENKIDLILSTNSLYLKFTFERKREREYASGGFGIDHITLTNNNADPSTTTSTLLTTSTTTSSTTTSSTTLLTSITTTSITTTSFTSISTKPTTTTFNNNPLTTSNSTKHFPISFLTTATPATSKFITTSKITQISTTQASENLSDNILIYVLVPLVSIILISVVVILVIYHKRPRDVSPSKKTDLL